MDLIVDLITPFKEDFTINDDKISRLIEDLLKVNCQQILFFGITGECYSLEFEELFESFKKVLERYQSRITPYLFLKFENIVALEKRIQLINSFKCNLVLELPQNAYSETGLLECFKFLVERSENPIYLFYDEDLNKNKYGVPFLKELSEIDTIQGMILNLHDENFLLELKKSFKKELILYNDTKISFGIVNDFQKCLSINSNIFYEKISEMILLKDFDILEYYQERFKVIHLKPIPIILKTYFNEYIYDVGKVRLPLKDLHYLEYECYLNKYKAK